MTAWGKFSVTAAMIFALTGCARLEPADSVSLSPVPGVALPYKARVMVFASDAELSRNLTIALTRYQNEETKIREGYALANAARIVLAKGFERVEVNDPSIRPQIIIKLTGGKASWSRLDGKMKTGCAVDAWTSDGIPLGTFVARYDAGETDYRSDLESAFAHCLKKPVEEFMNAPTLARLAGTGFRDPPAQAVADWMRTLGNIPSFK